MDRWIDSRVAFHLPTDVDLEAGVRRVRTLHRPQEVLLNAFSIVYIIIPRSLRLWKMREKEREGRGGGFCLVSQADVTSTSATIALWFLRGKGSFFQFGCTCLRCAWGKRVRLNKRKRERVRGRERGRGRWIERGRSLRYIYRSRDCSSVSAATQYKATVRSCSFKHNHFSSIRYNNFKHCAPIPTFFYLVLYREPFVLYIWITCV